VFFIRPQMDYHTAVASEFAYEPEYIACNLTYYTDVKNRHVNGLLVARVHSDEKGGGHLAGLSSSDLSTYYLSDLLSLLNMRDDGYRESVRFHKKATGDSNLIDYEDIRHRCKCVDDLWKMSRRTKIIGVSALDILHDERKLITGVCMQGQVRSQHSMFVPASNFYDTKVHPMESVADFLTTGLKCQTLFDDAKTHRYALRGSIIYLIVYIRDGIFDYVLYVSEEPVAQLVQLLLDRTERTGQFDLIYTVIGRTNTEDNSYPYTVTPDGVYLRDALLYCNECQFSQPVLATYERLHDLLASRR
jgi:hypothetical protein